ncbi:MAG: NR2-2/2HbN [Microgenomates group bacterium GW2011_GWA2_46_16]|uniref:Cytochrome b5 heme-binding domain-containing protein n=1 Tax=Candidatus Magasanikbacteria bacterium RIFOXYA2_FULL_44_8 TaxID=1798696 RepID=A0A1F6NL64_9BACT|nr:MAG: NR2-2/2HbN [Microgenomates group bacterium GW2011_GWA2_46_16]OGH84599.1 MAG: hypothetical protein A2261_03155 [Candidatus Magasanikbacteria bacterium RIFOXYA2_FULL_44_8]
MFNTFSKKVVSVALFIFWVGLVAILTAGLLSYEKNKPASNGNNFPVARSAVSASNISLATIKPPTNNIGKKVTLNLAEIAKHNTAENCWLLINSKVYDVTSYISEHPGGAYTIVPTCGTNATQAYDTNGRSGSSRGHSQYANSLLGNYYVGDLGQNVNAP